MTKIKTPGTRKPAFPAALSPKAASAKMGAMMNQRVGKPAKADARTKLGSKK